MQNVVKTAVGLGLLYVVYSKGHSDGVDLAIKKSVTYESENPGGLSSLFQEHLRSRRRPRKDKFSYNLVTILREKTPMDDFWH